MYILSVINMVLNRCFEEALCTSQYRQSVSEKKTVICIMNEEYDIGM
jgi:hypothetical protein